MSIACFFLHFFFFLSHGNPTHDPITPFEAIESLIGKDKVKIVINFVFLFFFKKRIYSVSFPSRSSSRKAAMYLVRARGCSATRYSLHRPATRRLSLSEAAPKAPTSASQTCLPRLLKRSSAFVTFIFF